MAVQSEKRKSSPPHSATVKATPNSLCEQKGLFKCTTCGFYSHLSCSRTTIASLERIASYLSTDEKTLGYADVYKCVDCLLVGKLPSYFVRMQCETY